SLAATRRGLTFYVAHPISSILRSREPGVKRLQIAEPGGDAGRITRIASASCNDLQDLRSGTRLSMFLQRDLTQDSVNLSARPQSEGQSSRAYDASRLVVPLRSLRLAAELVSRLA